MLRTAFYENEITPPLGCAIPGHFELRLGADVKDLLCAEAGRIMADKLIEMGK